MTPDPRSLRIVRYPDPALRARAAAIDATDDAVRDVAERMVELMREAEGIGLAAPQVGLAWRLFVADVPPADDRSPRDDPPGATDGALVFVNPTLSGFSRDLEPYEEGCLSLPHITGEVRRPTEVTVSAVGLDGAPFGLRAGGLLARCIQHETDHLDGVLIIDKMTPLARMKNRAAVRELEDGARVQ